MKRNKKYWIEKNAVRAKLAYRNHPMHKNPHAEITWVELEKPIHKGWNLSLTIDEKTVKRGSEVKALIESLCIKYYTRQVSLIKEIRRQKYGVRALLAKTRRFHYLSLNIMMKRIKREEYEKLSDYLKKFFAGIWTTRKNGIYQFYEFVTSKVDLKLHVEPYYHTHLKQLNGDMISEYKFLKDHYLKLNPHNRPWRYAYATRGKWNSFCKSILKDASEEKEDELKRKLKIFKQKWGD